MNYDEYEKSYQKIQEDRLLKSLQAINQKSVSNGLTIPQEESVVIGTGRRLSMAIMFLDICNFTSRLSETQTEQQNILDVLNLFFSEMVRIAEDYGGTVEKNTGDGLMAYFEDKSDANGCKRAVACSLTMFHITQNYLNPIFSKSYIQPIDFRIGIDYGNVTIAKVGSPRRFNSLVAIGTSANVACKILRFAGPNEIIIGDQVKQNLPSHWYKYIYKLTDNSGWVYRQSGLPYSYWKYDAKWRT